MSNKTGEKSRDGLLTKLSEETGGVGTIVVAGLATVVGGIYAADRLLPPTPNEVAAKEAKNFETAIVNGQSVRVLENGTADVTLNDKGKYAHLVNPIVTKAGHVIGRDKYTGKVIVYYKDGNPSSANEKNDAHQITFTKNGKSITEKEAVADSKPLVLETPQKVGNEFAYEAAPGQGFDHQPIAVGSPEKTETITTEKIVPDKG